MARPKPKSSNRGWFLKQLVTHSVAVVSLVAAIVGLSYNSWQANQNEVNQNMRIAAFEVLKNLGELQTVVNYAHFTEDALRGNPIEGWKHVTMVRDLSHLLKPSAKTESQLLYTAWQKDWEKLDRNQQVEQRISKQITKTREAVLSTIDASE
ncbi:MAG: hypothetical protein COB34_07395 [Methylophilaceae bacterium]|nr:MAG: hypothetical protein COB34_07395 [Methylophilaceae bacterium]